MNNNINLYNMAQHSINTYKKTTIVKHAQQYTPNKTKKNTQTTKTTNVHM